MTGTPGSPDDPGAPDDPATAARPRHEPLAGAPAPPERPIAADWLALRRPLDEQARDLAAPLLAELATALRHAGYDGSAPVHVVDVGAGTGANHAYLGPRLPFPADWTLVDHDPALLDHPTQGPGRRVLAEIGDVARLLAVGSARHEHQLVTCSALLDLLRTDELDGLLGAVLAARAPALLALTVTGGWALAPEDPDDALVRAAFDAHQAREDRPGPQAAAYVVKRARAAGARVVEALTPWTLPAPAGGSGSDCAALARFLADRADAAREQLAAAGRDAEAARVAGWLVRRLDEVAAGRLRVRVDHVDLLVLPART